MQTIHVRPIQPQRTDAHTTHTARADRTACLRALLLCVCTLVLFLASSASAGSNPVAPVGCSARAGTCVRIGIWLCPNPATCSSLPGHDRMIQWYKERVESRYNNRWAGVPIFWVELEIEGFFVSTPREIATKINESFIGPAAWAGTGGPLVDFTILPFGSLWDTGMPLLERWRIPSVGALSPDSRLFQCHANETIWRTQEGCTAPNTRRFQYAHGTPNPGEQYFEPWIGMLKRQKAKSIALVRTTIPFYLGVHDGTVAVARDNQIAITYDTLALLTGSPPAMQPETVSRIISEMQSLPTEPDAVAFLTQDCIPWIRALRAANFAPKSVAAILCSDSSGPLESLKADLNYIVGSSQWAASLTGADYTETEATQPWALFPATQSSGNGDEALTSPLLFQATYRDIMNSTTIVPGYADAGVLAAFEFLEGSVTLARSVDPELVQAQLKSFYQPSFYGLLSTNRFGQNNAKQLVINQRDGQGTLQVISPTYAATGDFLYPFPRWDERTYTHSMFASTVERVLIALVVACSVTTGLLMSWLYHNRHKQKWPAAKAVFWIIQGFGCLLAYAAVLTWPVENDAHTCSARIWLWTLAFHAFVDPLLASSYFIAAVTRQQLEVTKLSNRHLALGCLGLLAPQLLINILWASVAPLSTRVVTGDPLRPAYTSFTTCSPTGDGSSSLGFAVVTLAYSCLLLLIGCALAYRVRPSHRIYSDAQTITSTIYLFFTTAAVVLTVQVTLRNDDVSDQRVLFGLRSVGTLIAYQGSLALLYLRRILDVRAAISSGRTQHPAHLSQVGFTQSVGEPALARSPAAEATAVVPAPAAAAAALGAGVGPGAALGGTPGPRSTRLTPPGHSPVGTLPGTVTPASVLVLPRHDLSSHHHHSSSAGSSASFAPLSPPPPLPDRAELMALSTEECIELVHSYWSAIQTATSSLRRRQQMHLLSAAASGEDDTAHQRDVDFASSGSFAQMLRAPPRPQTSPAQPPLHQKQERASDSPVRLHGLDAAVLATPTGHNGNHHHHHATVPLPPGATPIVAAAASATPAAPAAIPFAQQTEEIELAPYPEIASQLPQHPPPPPNEECKGPAQL